MKTNKRGISLVILVITIIVLATLAGVALISIDGNTIISSSDELVSQTELNNIK